MVLRTVSRPERFGETKNPKRTVPVTRTVRWIWVRKTVFLDFEYFLLDILDKIRNVKKLPLVSENEIGKYHKILYLHHVFFVGKLYISPFTRMKYSLADNGRGRSDRTKIRITDRANLDDATRIDFEFLFVCYSCSSSRDSLGEKVPRTEESSADTRQKRVFESASEV